MRSFLLPDLQAFLRYEDLPGNEPVCVYLAGSGLSALGCFAAVASRADLTAQRSLFIDLLGSGYSDHPEGFAYSLEDHAGVVAALLDALGLANCAVVGASLGGAVAITLAALRPTLVSNLVLLEANLDPGDGALSRSIAEQSEQSFVAQGFQAVAQYFRQSGLNGDAGAATVAGMWQVAAPHALYLSLVGLARGTQPTMRQRLYDLTIPRTYIFGEHSLPDPNADTLPAYGVRTLVVADAGHGMMLDNPKGTADALQIALALS